MATAADGFSVQAAGLMGGGLRTMLLSMPKTATTLTLAVFTCLGAGLPGQAPPAGRVAADKKPQPRDFPYWTAPKTPHARAFIPGLQAALQLTPEQNRKIEAACRDTIDKPEAKTKETAGAAFDKAHALVFDILTADQKKRIEKINDAYAKAMEEVGGDFDERFAAAKGNEAETEKVRKELHEATVAAFEKRLDTILTADQRKAVKEAAEEHKRQEEANKKTKKPGQ
jgi:hypothetical protein